MEVLPEAVIFLELSVTTMHPLELQFIVAINGADGGGGGEEEEEEGGEGSGKT